ncbi:MAG: radical SAM protein [Candidatus Omnitrophota bacterium]
MCYAIPGKVVSLSGKTAIIDYFGEQKRAFNELSGLAAGDYVYAQGGYVIQKVPPAQAQEILSTWHELFLQLNEVDLRYSRLADNRSSGVPELDRILDKACLGRKLGNEEMLYLLGLRDTEQIGMLLKSGNFLRQKYHRNACCVHGILEISNRCSRNCAYCGISSHNKRLSRYRMTKEEVLSCVGEAVECHGFKAVVLQSGEQTEADIEELSGLVRAIKEKYAVLVLVSFGEIGEEGLSKLFSAGARGLLMRFETSNPALYRSLHPGYELDSRVRQIRAAYRMGYLIITGGLIGLPGQTRQDIINDIHLAAELDAEMFSFGPVLPHPGTPLSGISAPSEDELFKVLALARIAAPAEAKILLTTAAETLTPDAGRKGLLAGANSLMLNLTPLAYRPLYSLYPSRAHSTENISLQVEGTMQLLKSLGRVPIDLGIGL